MVLANVRDYTGPVRTAVCPPCVGSPYAPKPERQSTLGLR